MSDVAGGAAAGRRASPVPDPGLERAAAIGIHRIELSTPFAVGTVNTYLIEDDPLVLVDVGPNFGSTSDELVAALAQRGHRLADIGLIVITHQHIDHVGLLSVLAHRCDAEIAAWYGLEDYLADFTAAAAADDAFAIAVMRRHGVPADIATALGEVSVSFRQFGSGTRLTRPLRDGDTITLRDRTLSVHHRPGHSPSDLLFHDPAASLAIGGDHLLATISSNALVSRALQGPPLDVTAGERPQPLLQYSASLTATRAMGIATVVGGHGASVGDPARLIDDRLRSRDRRARKIAELLAPGPQTAYELARRMWGNVAVTQAFLTLSEVLGHLDLLIESGGVTEDREGPVTRFSLS